MNKKSLAGAVLLSGLLIPSHAHAFNVFVCSGDPVLWSQPFAMVRNAPSIPVGGQRQASVLDAVDRWNNVQGMGNMVSMSPFINPGVIFTDDGVNDVGVVSRASLGGHNGLTFMVHDLCLFSAEWEEANVLVASDLNFAPVSDETSLATSGRLTFLHEFGHAHGLADAQGYNIMRAQPNPLVGGTGTHVDVLPDDARGGRFLYPTGNDEVNLFASAHRRTANNTIVANNTGTLTFCSKGGGSLTLNATVGNNGTVDMKQTERWWLTPNKNGHNGGVFLGQWTNGTFPANSVITRSLTFKLPPLEPDTYFVFHGVDVLDEFNESREDDNSAREAVTIKINNC